MNTRLLIDAIVRQTTVLIAQLSTAAGIRAHGQVECNDLGADATYRAKRFLATLTEVGAGFSNNVFVLNAQTSSRQARIRLPAMLMGVFMQWLIK